MWAITKTRVRYGTSQRAVMLCSWKGTMQYALATHLPIQYPPMDAMASTEISTPPYNPFGTRGPPLVLSLLQWKAVIFNSTFTGERALWPFREERGTCRQSLWHCDCWLNTSTLHTVKYQTWSGVFNKLKFDHLLKKNTFSNGCITTSDMTHYASAC